MARQRVHDDPCDSQLTDDLYDIDASFSAGRDADADDLFDIDEDVSSPESGATESEDFSDDNSYVTDQVHLFAGNVHPPDYYQKALREFNESAFNSRDYSPGSIVLLDAIKKQWRTFCTDVVGRDPQTCFESINIRLLYNFFDWSLNQRVGKNGRKKKGTKKSSSLGTTWKVFRLVYETAIGAKLDPKLNHNMHQVLGSLAKKHKLSDQKRENRCMTIDDLKAQIKTTLSTTEKSFDLGELRILTVLFLLFLAPAGSRPQSILRLRFGDIRVVLARDPDGGPHKLLIKFTLEFTKTYLGTKDAKTFTIPETMFDPSLLLSPHVFLLGILFQHQAFRAPSLVSPRLLDDLDIHPDEKELPLPLRDDLKDVCIFRRAITTSTGLQISQAEPITYGMMSGWIKRIREILGLQYPTIAYSLRYNTGNELDQSSDVSESLRNLTLDHANSIPFQKHYLGRAVCADLWGILRGQKPQQALLKQSCSIGHSMSKRRPADLTPEQAASVNTDPDVRRLTKQLKNLQLGTKQQIEAQRELRNLKQRLKRLLFQKIREDWTDEQAIDDIKNQLQGVAFTKPVLVDIAHCPQLPAQKRLVEALNAPVDPTLEGQYRRRDDAINAIITYCSVKEGPTSRRKFTSPTKEAQSKPTYGPPEDNPVSIARLSMFVRNDRERPRRCFLCIGAALPLEPDDRRVEDLTHEFCNPGALTKHFQRKHLSLLKPDSTLKCEVCDITLSSKMHLQNHALRVHGTVS
ncbi:Uu.00g129990.m01.CDS01 [Anthostomella pinea]|uniref:Uu.00g129990.m01.CDS01 n=1 Tax=Anthostomella pinea TaxID=933095 RepID=A0AAI8VJJ5_9PEZI|nr:Uu.00g129990.m01.CDS01 [Anthostomella pinea]